MTLNNEHYYLGEANTGHYDFKGMMDEVRISNIVRTPEEIQKSALTDLDISRAQLQLPDNRKLPESDVVGLWNFNEGAGNTVHDISGNGNDGTLYGMDDNDWVDGIKGKALDFDGSNDYVDVLPTGDLDFTNELTIEAWINRGNADTYDAITGRINTSLEIGWNFAYRDSESRYGSNSIYFFYFDNGGNRHLYETGQRNENLGAWQHISLVFKSGYYTKIFVNGIEDNGVWIWGNGNSPIHDWSSSSLRIGHDNFWEYNNFHGAIDEIAFYNSALTSQEILFHSKFQHNKATIRSETISLPKNTTWDLFQAHRSVPENTYLNISVHDANTGEVLIRNTGNTNPLTLDLSTINPSQHGEIYLQAYLQSNETETPILYDWGIQSTTNSSWPVAIAGNDITIDPGEIVKFNGSGSYDNIGIVNYSWSFSYRGKINLFGEKVEFRFDDAGSFLVTLNVSDAEGLWGIDEMFVTVGDTIPPVADPGPDMIVDQYTSVLLDGSASSDNIEIVNYSWSFDYNGGIILLYGVKATFNFSLPGVYVITLRVVDFHENWAENSSAIEVRDIIKPTAMAGKDIVVLKGKPIILNGNGSSDNVGIVNYFWVFRYDGDPIVLNDENITFVFDIIGEYDIRLLVRDRGGNEGTDNLTVFVMENGEEQEVEIEESIENDTDSDGDGWNDTAEVESGSDPYDNRSTPHDWDGDGVPNGRDAYPRDSGRWIKEKEAKRLKIAVYFGLGVIVLLICFISYTRISKKNIFQNGKREQICSYIRQNPGLHFRELSRRMKINSGTLYHHMRKLEQAKIINPISDGYYMRYYYGSQEIKLNSVTPMQERILKVIGVNSGITYKQLIQKMDLSYPTISYHITALSDSGLVNKEKEDGLIHLYLKES